MSTNSKTVCIHNNSSIPAVHFNITALLKGWSKYGNKAYSRMHGIFSNDYSKASTHKLILSMILSAALPLQAEGAVCGAEAHLSMSVRSRGSQATPAVPEYHQREEQKAQGLHPLSSLPVSPSRFIIPSSLLFFFTSQSISHTLFF